MLRIQHTLKLLTVLLLTVQASGISAQASQENELIFGQYERQLGPLNDFQAELVGWLTSHIENSRIKFFPSHARVVSAVRNQPNLCSGSFVSDIDKLGVIMISVVAEHDVSVFRTSNTVSDSSMNEPIVVVQGSSSQQLANASKIRTITIPSRADVITMLALGREFMIIEVDELVKTINASYDEPVLNKIYSVGQSRNWLACSEKTDPKFITALKKAWDKGIRSGALAAIYERHGYLNVYPYSDTDIAQAYSSN